MDVTAEPQVGQEAPDFTLPSTQGPLTLSRVVADKKVILAFYFEDNTPLCASEIASLKEDYAMVQALGAEVIGVSADGLASHQAFAQRLGGLPFPLVADEKLEAAHLYGVVDDSGKRSRRAVFVIDRGGKILHAIRRYSPSNFRHYEEIFSALGMPT